ncbi:putative transcription factor WRKY family [Rosa chinensis]|uniref:Putative transcription factor WRKY family n=1 Tax=Rosa chinensis TaxID=74649 RepID=A0A2P6SIE0_ROSCH|nr:probable WRKY transcription factor 46 [Rosa chinensis]PRQ58416.1 putative transcription factor WRKY family [Rosa chinensis]
MEKRKSMMGNWEQKILKSELTQGKELAQKLMNHLHHSSSSQEGEFLISKLLSSYEKALSVLTRDVGSEGEIKQIQVLDSPCSFGNSSSPLSEISDQDCKNKNVFKKRKPMPKRTEEVKVCSGTGQDGSLDDGYSWRKYGQKDILGAKYPRGYYRCTHRNTQGCLATKQVQKSDADPTIFMVTYTGLHTCHLVAQLNGKQNVSLKQEAGTPRQTPEKSFSFGLRVKTENLDTREEGKKIFPSFSFPPTPIESENNVVEDHVFAAIANDFLGGSYAQTFGSPATFESDYFAAVSPCHFGLVRNDVQTSDSDLTHEILSASTSVANSPIGDFGFSLEDLDFYPFENNPESTFP